MINLSDTIQLLMLIASTTAIIVSAVMSRQSIAASMKMVKEQNYIQMFAEYTKRYQEILMEMPSGAFDGTESNDKDVLRYMQLYFNLCSEEYDLRTKDAISEDVWEKWLAGMIATMRHPNFLRSWEQLRLNYAPDFVNFFNNNVITSK